MQISVELRKELLLRDMSEDDFMGLVRAAREAYIAARQKTQPTYRKITQDNPDLWADFAGWSLANGVSASRYMDFQFTHRIPSPSTSIGPRARKEYLQMRNTAMATGSVSEFRDELLTYFLKYRGLRKAGHDPVLVLRDPLYRFPPEFQYAILSQLGQSVPGELKRRTRMRLQNPARKAAFEEVLEELSGDS